MAELLKRNTGPENLSTSFWPVDKVLFAYLTFTGLLILGWWREVPGSAAFFGLHVIGMTLMVYEVKRPNPTSWVFRNWYPLPYVASCYKEMAMLIPPIRRTDSDQWLAQSGFPDLARQSHGLAGANSFAGAHRIPASGVHAFRAGGAVGGLSAVEKRQIPGVPILCFFNRAGIPGFVYRVPDGARAGTALSAEILQHIPLQGLWLFHGMQHTLDRWNRPITIAFRAATPNSPSWHGGAAE